METTLILGPPGTGKTKTLGDIFEKELSEYGTQPHRIAYVSFTREGTYVGVQRVMQRFNLSARDLPFCRTWHSLCFKMVGARRESMMDKEHYKRLSRALGMSFVGHYTEDFTHNDDKLIFFNDLRRNNPDAFRRYLTHEVDFQRLNYVARQYINYKRAFGVYDFTDLIEVAIHSGEAIDVDAVLMDEAQDYPTLQWQLAFALFGNAKRWYIAGDDDQAIYTWAGADVKKFMRISSNIMLLDTSWRLPDNILRFAKLIAKRINDRLPKDYHGTGKQGELRRLANLEMVRKELNAHADESWLLLSRNNKFLQEYARILMEEGFVFSIKGVISIKPLFLEWVKIYEDVQKGKEVSKQDKERFDLCVKDEKDVSLPWWENTKISAQTCAYIRKYLERFPGQYELNLNKDGTCRIRVNTVHTVKGAEAENVIILSDITKRINENLMENPDDEHRVFYVAVTRASKRLFLVTNTLSNFFYPWPMSKEIV